MSGFPDDILNGNTSMANLLTVCFAFIILTKIEQNEIKVKAAMDLYSLKPSNLG